MPTIPGATVRPRTGSRNIATATTFRFAGTATVRLPRWSLGDTATRLVKFISIPQAHPDTRSQDQHGRELQRRNCQPNQPRSISVGNQLVEAFDGAQSVGVRFDGPTDYFRRV